MNKGYLYVLFFLLGALLMFFWMKGCGPSSGIEKLQDSLQSQKALNDTIVWQTKALGKATDSLSTKNTKDSQAYRHIIDSQAHVIAVFQGKFKVSRDSIFTLYTQLKKFYEAHDTVALLRAYMDLRQQLTDANQLLFTIQIQRDSADNMRSVEIERLNGLITQLKGQIGALNDLLVKCTDNGAALAQTANKAIKKAKAGILWVRIGAVIAAIAAILYVTK